MPKPSRIHVADLLFKSYFMFYRPSKHQLRQVQKNGSSRRLYREYEFFIDLLNDDSEYSHDTSELYDRLVELSRDQAAIQNKKLARRVAKLLAPAEFLLTLALLVEHKLILLEISRFTKDRIIQGQYEGTYSSRTGWRPGDAEQPSPASRSTNANPG